MGFGQIIENLKRIKKKKIIAENEAGKLAPNHLKTKAKPQQKKKKKENRQPKATKFHCLVAFTS